MKKAPIATTNVMIPLENPDGDASFAGHVTYKQVKFHNFASGRTYCGKQQHAITLNPKGSDIIPLVDFIENEFNNVDDSAFIYMFTPPDSWITVRECGSFPCTGPWNTVFSFSNTKYSGKAKIYKQDKRDWQIIPANPGVTPAFKDCKLNSNWNAFYCREEQFGILHFESQDEDKGKRNIYPVTLTPLGKNNKSYKNVLNQFLEHTCDGIYPGLFRLARFVALVGLADGGTGSNNGNEGTSANMNGNTVGYDIAFSGTVPDTMGFKLQSSYGARDTGIVVQIRYNKKNTFAIRDENENLIEAITFDEGSGSVPLLPQRKTCGENRYLPLENTLQFYITTDDCQLQIVPLDVVRATIRM